MGLSRGSFTNQGTDSLTFVKQLTHKVSDTHAQSDVPATSAESDLLSRDLKARGFKFVGSTIVYAHMQATGLVNDHLIDCFRYAACADSD